MENVIKEKMIVCSLLNVFSVEEMQGILIALSDEPEASLDAILLRKGIWKNQATAFKRMDAVKEALKREGLERKKERLNQTDTKICTIIDEDYPQLLKEMYQPPLVLYYQGDWSLTKKNMLGVVGSRIISDYGKKVVKDIIPSIVTAGVVTVSGLAKGIDYEVHKQTLETGGRSIAIIGTGLDRFYPSQNRELQNQMATEHLVVSEYPLGTGPQKLHFPTRNRIIAGMSQGVLVIEAKERSGSLITANLALQENREVFAVPGNILNPAFKGTNQLIQAGAKAVLCYPDIALEMDKIWK